MRSKNHLLFDAILFFVMAVFVILLWNNNLYISILLLIEAVLAAGFIYNVKEKIFFIFLGIFGLVLEIIGSSLGIWTYAFPNLVTVPFWIFFAWGFTFMLFHSIYLVIKPKAL